MSLVYPLILKISIYILQNFPPFSTSNKMGSDEAFFHYSIISYLLIGPPTYISCRYITAPYGKHHRKGWGPTVPPSLAWFLMESPTLWFTLLLFPLGQNSSNPKSLILISPFILHYFHRTVLYPLRLRKKPSNGYPISVALIAFVYNLFNSYLQARWVSEYADYDTDNWFWWRFCGGLVVFLCGMVVNVRSDMELLRLKEGGGGYKIPRGGLFEYVSCANYFGEIVEWSGWWLMTGSWVGLGFLLYTCANLVPRARANHMWYLEKFGEDYPKKRKIVIPFVY
ncbi:putative 3-oxo-5-alpha-steroid 4-dehydrogenase (NADP(+)) [Helianthus annuus]|uniref:Steroid 5-alpha-reductase DET2 n=2 Tax=Helianthus annuus TaxID=4232 RepID=A0A9K3JSV2_HELAN|nr:steroid 5-alpha-reductase DET2 [Helianthus annuus]KAF5821113.1 putative 3-oxo-5-alpha-steroid 4-dehydrogenase (NADP(+)) [Helianthus annuus]KAJ0610835.1 putative 3-oxo-5-alpha-steroid 4-dehydrogenase (NADP(+)) [Helianthus annuus]KAJ0621656.1 putative 3-oxo-5-alpha-steroid 4-dehydrogenase (NADP(+)) [Helianthus annuus]KAJ0626079.1 putative 3-oxo-5-alpha-steroid 4-dehydrogenase (NADP(+)) [Helianthus annuus]KAJ0782417.1 putative 3-oxo-5-alpha-steroid 4-dehydrogenase (NADP(+)) [Helianthus annuus]